MTGLLLSSCLSFSSMIRLLKRPFLAIKILKSLPTCSLVFHYTFSQIFFYLLLFMFIAFLNHSTLSTNSWKSLSVLDMDRWITVVTWCWALCKDLKTFQLNKWRRSSNIHQKSEKIANKQKLHCQSKSSTKSAIHVTN